ncbi:MAG: HDOD domain-containing protein [Thiobacillus sp.]|nr:HDOD domain-containing protein [Thiobacillus sp.]
MAAMTLEQWLARLKPGETPVFRHTKQALLELAPRGEQVSAKEIAAPILADPLATLRLIYNANNRSSRYFDTEVATVEHAILMQGVSVFLGKVGDLPVLEDTPQGQDKLILSYLYRLARLSQHASWQARDFGTLYHDTRSEELQVAAVLYHAPEFLFWLDAPDIAEELAQLRRRLPSAEAEKQAIGFALPPLREMLLESWKIPEVTRGLLKSDSGGHARRRILWATLDIAHHSRRGWWNEHLTACYETLAEIERMPVDQVIATVHDNAIRAARAGSWVHAEPAAAWLPMEPGEWPKEREISEVKTPSPEQEVAEHTVCPMPNRSVLEETLANIEGHLDGTLSLSQMLAVILKGLHTGLGLSRVLFALITPDGKRVKCRFTLGIPSEDPLRHFEFPLDSKDLFGILMTKMQSVWINEENRGKLWPRVAPELRARIGRGDFYTMSLFGNDKPIGLIYADRGHGDCALDARTYDDFKKLCLEAAKGLSKIKPANP